MERGLADIVSLIQTITREKTNANSLSAYTLNMAIRLLPMKRVLKDTGSIFLHCDPIASHYLKLVMDAIFRRKNFRNEITWERIKGAGKRSQHEIRNFGRSSDIIFFYSKGNDYNFYADSIARPYPDLKERFPYKDKKGRFKRRSPFRPPGLGPRPNLVYKYKGILPPHPSGWTVTREKLKKLDKEGEVEWVRGKPWRKQRPAAGIMPNNIWTDINVPAGEERLGYPTQKPLDLLRRIIKACSNEGGLILDPFCGCGTTVHAAEELNRRWIGIDISKFSTGLIRERVVNHFQNKGLSIADIEIVGTPTSLEEAQALAERDKFEFEKWVCGEIGAHGMFREPGERGADGGVDGVIDFGLFEGWEKGVEKSYAIVQVKGGKVTADSVRALYATVKRFNAQAGIFVCFDRHMRTVENNRVKCTYKDVTGTYPVIQGFSIESLLNNEKPELPPLVAREGGKMKETSGLFANH